MRCLPRNAASRTICRTPRLALPSSFLMRPFFSPTRGFACLALPLSAFLLTFLFSPLSCSAQEESQPAPLPVFEFHSGFWLNLHHTLYRQARLQRSSNAGANAVAATVCFNDTATAE